ncbi:MAG: hypothetical protein EHM21_00120 [Chloroflexi bacterium]|nr:MAG: hypothetical protein EHM21_00120 [Chloroflexota bacterium]
MTYLVLTFHPVDEPAWAEELASLLEVQAQQGWHFVGMGTRSTPVTQAGGMVGTQSGVPVTVLVFKKES